MYNRSDLAYTRDKTLRTLRYAEHDLADAQYDVQRLRLRLKEAELTEAERLRTVEAHKRYLSELDGKLAEDDTADKIAELNEKKEALYDEYSSAIRRDKPELALRIEAAIRKVDAELSELITKYTTNGSDV